MCGSIPGVYLRWLGPMEHVVAQSPDQLVIPTLGCHDSVFRCRWKVTVIAKQARSGRYFRADLHPGEFALVGAFALRLLSVIFLPRMDAVIGRHVGFHQQSYHLCCRLVRPLSAPTANTRTRTTRSKLSGSQL